MFCFRIWIILAVELQNYLKIQIKAKNPILPFSKVLLLKVTSKNTLIKVMLIGGSRILKKGVYEQWLVLREWMHPLRAQPHLLLGRQHHGSSWRLFRSRNQVRISPTPQLLAPSPFPCVLSGISLLCPFPPLPSLCEERLSGEPGSAGDSSSRQVSSSYTQRHQ